MKIGETPLYWAILHKNAECIACLKSHGANDVADESFIQSNTELHYDCRDGRISRVRSWIEINPRNTLNRPNMHGK